MNQVVIGRERELAVLDGFLDSIADGPAALVVSGEAGIGKTAVWTAALEAASARSYVLLRAQPTATEAKLSFSGVADLLAGVETGMLELAPPQRRALDVALLRAEPEEEPPDVRALGTALASVFTGLAGKGPLVVAVDDVQWLDRPSAAVLEFALRRLDSARVGVLVAVRDSVERAAPLDLERGPARPGLVKLRLGPLSVASLHHVIGAQLGHQFARPTLVRIERASGGNPLFALEIARALLRQPTVRAAGPLPVPERLQDLVGERIQRLPKRTRDALVAAAASARPSLRVLESIGFAEADVAPAEAAGVVSLESERLTFAHSLLASAAYFSATPDRRRVLHRSLAEATPDAEERARHLALGAAGPDEQVAAVLEDAARSARARGAAASAAELAEEARRLTPSPREAARRAVMVGEYLFEAGDVAASRTLLHDAAQTLRSGHERARALLRLAWGEWYAGDRLAAVRAGEQALEDAVSEARLTAEIAWSLARFNRNDLRQAVAHARRAAAAGVGEEDPELAAIVAFEVLHLRLVAGEDLELAELERALDRLVEVQERHGSWRLWSLGAVQWLIESGRLARARRVLEEMLERRRGEGNDSAVAELLVPLAWVELMGGNWARAAEYGEEARDAIEQSGRHTPRNHARRVLAAIAAREGRVDDARKAAEEAVAWGEASGDLLFAASNLETLGFLALSEGDYREADSCYTRASDHATTVGIERTRFGADHAEALIALGELDRAEELLQRLEERNRVLRHRWLDATLARSRGLLYAASGDLDAASGATEAALADHDDLGTPFERARTLVVLGQIRRRRNDRRAAKATLEEALGVFETLGARLWAERTAAELRRIPIRRRSRDDTLTPSEQQVAELAAAGRTNREIAQELFMSPKTVDANLGRVYRKLGIRSRAQLGARMGSIT